MKKTVLIDIETGEMVKTYYIKDTGEKIVADVEGDYELSEEDRKKVEQARKKARLRLFSNNEKKRYLIKNNKQIN